MKSLESGRRLKIEEAPENSIKLGAEGARRTNAESLRQSDGECIFL